MNRIALNADVLLEIFSLAGNQTKLALMSTCQALYRDGDKQFLKSVDVKIDMEHRVESFHRFMMADGGSRKRSLRRLYVDLKNPSRAVAVQLKTLLASLTPVSRLADLNIFCLEPLLSVHPPLSRTITTLTSLEKVSFQRLGARSLEMLGAMQSKLTTVCLDPTGMGGRGYHLFNEASDRGGTFITFLQQFSASLRNLSLVAMGDTIEPHDDTPQYPLLSSLTLESALSAPVTWHYVRTFPNLKTLTITGLDMEDVEDFGLTEFRMRNRTQLREHGCWPSFDMFEGSIVALWLLGLLCPVQDVRANIGDQEVVDDSEVLTPNMTRKALRPARPKRLDITFFGCHDMFLGDGVTAAIAEGCGATVRELSVTLEVNPHPHTEHGALTKVLDAIKDMLRGFSALESLALCLDFAGVDTYTQVVGQNHPLPKEVYDGQEMYMHAVCAALREIVPSANSVRLTFQDHWTPEMVTVEMGSEA